MSAAIHPAQRAAASKLRHSCNPCAAAKVKCDKEKPTCTRCTKHGLSCEYVATKRAGRISHAANKQQTNNTAPILAVRGQPRSSPIPTVTQALHTTWSSSTTSSEAGVLLSSPGLSQPSTGQHTPTYSEILATLLSPADSASASMPTTASTDLDNFFASVVFDPDLLFPPLIDSSDKNNDNNNNNNLFPDSSGAVALPTPTDAFPSSHESSLELPDLSYAHSPSNDHRTSANTDTLPGRQGFRIDSPCCCLIRALGFFTQLFPNASEVCTQGNENGSAIQLPCFQRVVEQNKQIIEAISQILQCPCSYDSYLLVIVSLVVFKVLGWYTAAACTTLMDEGQSPDPSGLRKRRRSSSRPEQVIPGSPIIVGGYHIDGEDQGRMAAQLVLSELHGVQRLVNLLSQQLHKLGQEPRGEDEINAPLESAIQGGQGPLREREIFTLPFSAKFFNQLEADLRKRLRALSREIVDMLRRG
ncbi:hypothetical protein MMC30_009081 [Trapelia coarctata]|nr:hypothetical protein [Trapelia coarctata]